MEILNTSSRAYVVPRIRRRRLNAIRRRLNARAQCFPFTRFPPFPLFCTSHIILLSLLLYHEEYHSLPFTNHHFPLYMSLHILLLIMRCEFRFGNLQEENQCKFKSSYPNAIESVNISPELRSLAQPMLHEHFLVYI